MFMFTTQKLTFYMQDIYMKLNVFDYANNKQQFCVVFNFQFVL